MVKRVINESKINCLFFLLKTVQKWETNQYPKLTLTSVTIHQIKKTRILWKYPNCHSYSRSYKPWMVKITKNGILEVRGLRLTRIIRLGINLQILLVASVMGEKGFSVFTDTCHIFSRLRIEDINKAKSQIEFSNGLFEFLTHQSKTNHIKSRNRKFIRYIELKSVIKFPS